MSAGTLRGGLGPLLLAAGLVLVGCGSDDGSSERVADSPTPADSAEASTEPSVDPSGAASPGAAALPDCAETWVAGATLPRRYRGCTEDGATVDPESRACSIGMRLFTHGDRFYAVPGGPVQEATPVLLEDPDYRQALAVCTG